MRSRTILGYRGDKVVVRADRVPPSPSLRPGRKYVYVSSIDSDISGFSCAMLTPGAALRLANALRAAAEFAARRAP